MQQSRATSMMRNAAIRSRLNQKLNPRAHQQLQTGRAIAAGSGTGGSRSATTSGSTTTESSASASTSSCGCTTEGAAAGSCSLYDPATECGFSGSFVAQMGGTVIMDPSSCANSGLARTTDHKLAAHPDTCISCPCDGDVMMFRGGADCCWGNATFEEFFAKNCYKLPEPLDASACADALAAATSGGTRSLALSSLPLRDTVVSSSGIDAASSLIFGNGYDLDLTLTSDSEINNDMYWRDLNLNGYTLFTKGYRVFVSGTLDAGERDGHVGTISNNGGDAGTGLGAGEPAPAGTLGGASIRPDDYSIAGSAGARLVPDNEGGLALLSEASTAIRGRALDGRRLTGGASGSGAQAGGGGGVVMLAVRRTARAGILEARGGAPGQGSLSSGGGGGAVILVQGTADTAEWEINVGGGDRDRSLKAGRSFLLRA